MFFHFLCLSLSLLGAQNIFLGLNFGTISLDNYVKIQFLDPSRVVLFGPSFPFFPTFFFSRFLSFLMLLIFSFLFFFLFISSFFDFLMSFIFFFHFSEEKVSSFFSCISFKYFSCWR